MDTPATVLVQLVWPPERGPKDDCRNRTAVVWRHHGDVQEYPAALWPKLAAHPDVWRLVDPSEDIAQLRREAQALAEAEKQREHSLALQAARARARGAERATDVVLALTAGGHTLFDEAALEALDDASIQAEGRRRGYRLHPRLNSQNLRARFLAMQSLEEGSGIDELPPGGLYEPPPEDPDDPDDDDGPPVGVQARDG